MVDNDLLNALNDATENDETPPELEETDDEQEILEDVPDDDDDEGQGVVIDESDDQNPVLDEREVVVDLVLCMDVTGSMQNLVDAVKDFALSIPSQMVKKLAEVPRVAKTMRVKVVAFRDFYHDYVSTRCPACEISPFFNIIKSKEVDNDEVTEFEEFVKKLVAAGGGRENPPLDPDPESSYEALHLAFTSEWNDDTSPTRRRVVILLTDSVPHKIDDERRTLDEIQHPLTGKMGYPEDMPNTLSDLREEYLKMHAGHYGRLMIYGRECDEWNTMQQWTGAQFWPAAIKKTGGLDIEMDALYRLIQKSM